jgi:hypothetical protein
MIKFLDYATWKDGKESTEKVPIRVSYLGLKKLKESLGRSISPTDDGTDYEAYERLLFHSLETGYKFTNTPFPFKIDEMEMVMDSLFIQFMEIMPEFFGDVTTDPPSKKKGKVARKK